MGTSEAFYRNAIDLNRFSNSVSKKIITSYNDIILETVYRLASIDELAAPDTALRLRTLLAQLQESLGTWAIDSTTVTAQELQGLAALQSEFVQGQLKKVLPKEHWSAVRSVQISPNFAKSVVSTDPTKLNILALPGELERAVLEGAQPTFSLTASQGSVITLPNGTTVEKAFRGLAASQADLFSKTVRNGLLSGDTTSQIAKQLKGRLHFGQAGSVRQIALAGGDVTKMANNQVVTIVRTSINQVANSASQKVYEANQDITERYQYVATLDSRTSAICARLDGQEFEYGKGPMPPQHFNCRSTTIPVIDKSWYEKRGLEPPTEGKRAAKWGKGQTGKQVPAGMKYADWLKQQPRSVQEEVLGKWKSQYFVKLSEKEGAQSALRKIVRKDGSEKTLEQLRRTYGTTKQILPSKPVVPEIITKTVANPVQAYGRKTSKKLGKGVAGEARLVSDKAGGVVVKRGKVSEFELAALKKLKGTGLAPEFYGYRLVERAAAISTTSNVNIKTGYLTMSKAKGRPVLKELLDGRPTFQDTQNIFDSYLSTRKALHLKGVAHNDMHVLNFFYDKKKKSGMLVDFGMARNNPKAALIEALGTGLMKTKLYGGDWQSRHLMDDLELIGKPGFLSKTNKKFKQFVKNRNKVRKLLKEELDGPELLSRSIRERTDNLVGISDAKALKYLEMLYDGV